MAYGARTSFSPSLSFLLTSFFYLCKELDCNEIVAFSVCMCHALPVASSKLINDILMGEKKTLEKKNEKTQ